MKYGFIFLSLIWLFLLYLLISTVLERGLPANPIYYISAAFGVIIGYILSLMDKMREKIVAAYQRLGMTIAIVIIVLLLVSFAFSYSGNEIIRLIGKGYYFWFFFSMTGFWGYSSFKKWRISKKQSESGEITKNTS